MSEGMRHRRPGPDPVRTEQDAKRAAARWMRYWGFDDATVTPGPNSGIDVTSARAFAKVDIQSAAVDRPALLEIDGGRPEAIWKRPFFFAGTSYSSRAVTYAEERGISLFTVDASDGRVCAHSNPARAMVDAARARDCTDDREPRQVPSISLMLPATIQTPADWPSVSGPATTSPLIAGQTQQGLSSTSAGCLAVMLFVAATCLQLGVLAAGYRPDGVTVLVAVLALAGAVAYVVGLLTLFIAVVTARRAGRRAAPAASVFLASAPGVALWLATGIYIDHDRGSAAGFLQAILMTVPLVCLLVVAMRPLDAAREPDRA
jgi:hypothetical protein